MLQEKSVSLLKISISNIHKQTHSHNIYTYLLINICKLPAPRGIIEKLSEVESVVIGTIALSMIGRSQSGQFVPVDGVALEEKLDLLRNLQ